MNTPRYDAVESRAVFKAEDRTKISQKPSLSYLVILCFLSPAPSAPPENVMSYNLSVTSIYVTWSPVQEEFLNGILRAYQVFYRKSSDTISSPMEIFLTVSSPSVNISDLAKFTVYSVWVKAVTTAAGPSSIVVNVTTGEDGKIFFFHLRAWNFHLNLSCKVAIVGKLEIFMVDFLVESCVIRLNFPPRWRSSFFMFLSSQLFFSTLPK